MKVNLWNCYGQIIATGSLPAITNHLYRLVEHGHGTLNDYDIIEHGKPQFPWE